MDEGFEQALIDLGLETYLRAFLSTGFVDWDSLSSITEFDLEALGMRLGDRRKLEREIARRGGWPDERALPRIGSGESSSGSSCQGAQSGSGTTEGEQAPENANGKRTRSELEGGRELIPDDSDFPREEAPSARK